MYEIWPYSAEFSRVVLDQNLVPSLGPNLDILGQVDPEPNLIALVKSVPNQNLVVISLVVSDRDLVDLIESAPTKIWPSRPWPKFGGIQSRWLLPNSTGFSRAGPGRNLAESTPKKNWLYSIKTENCRYSTASTLIEIRSNFVESGPTEILSSRIGSNLAVFGQGSLGQNLVVSAKLAATKIWQYFAESILTKIRPNSVESVPAKIWLSRLCPKFGGIRLGQP